MTISSTRKKCRAFIVAVYGSGSPTMPAAEDPWLRSNANAKALGSLDVPTLVTGGLVDPVTPPENARWIAKRIPGAKLELFDDAHAYLFSERARFARVVDDFLD